jgi:hypothetical protein
MEFLLLFEDVSLYNLFHKVMLFKLDGCLVEERCMTLQTLAMMMVGGTTYQLRQLMRN